MPGKARRLEMPSWPPGPPPPMPRDSRDEVQYDVYWDRVILDDHGYPLISIGKDTDP